MYVDSTGNIGVTADPQKVRPGMIYVDLSSRRNRRQIYEAYLNGASLIFTPHNISNPDLPVIKVKNPQDTLYMLFNGLFGKQQQQARLIGILGDSDKSVLVDLIQNILREVNTSDGMNAMPVTIDTNSYNLFYMDMSLDSAILTDRGYLEGNCGSKPEADFFLSLLKKKTIIVNNDEPYAMKAVEDCKEIMQITYGLNKKAAVTASSIDAGETTCFNYCVQRSFLTKSGKRVEPFEIPVHFNAMGSHNIYNALAAITCGLYYDAEITNIKDSVESYKPPARHFQRIYDGEFTIIDNYCNSLQDYTAAFESLQILSCENLMLIISLSNSSSLSFHVEKACLIAEWVKMLKCKEVILTSCMDGDARIGELPLKSMRIYKKVFKENDIPFRYYHLLQHSIERSISELKKRDMLVMLGSDEMNMAHRLLCRHLKPINNEKH
ncbi:MAG TPA: Mur ligase family protein [Clostridia bacterium]|nr:Mur ligase family protein [Clostridia bacterium]